MIEESITRILERIPHGRQDANGEDGEANEEVSPPLTDACAGTATNDNIADSPAWEVWTHSDAAVGFVPERYSLPNASLLAALRLWNDRIAARNIRPFRLLRADDWELTGEDQKSISANCATTLAQSLRRLAWRLGLLIIVCSSRQRTTV